MGKAKEYRKRYGNEFGDTIPVVIIAFHDLQDLWFHKDEYDKIGKFKGVLKEMCLSIRSVKKVFHSRKLASSFPTQEWEG